LANENIIYVPISQRNLITFVLLEDTTYINCYDDNNLTCEGKCIYDIMHDIDKKLCPLKSFKSNNCPLLKNHSKKLNLAQ
jgi:hypothetical protein